MTRVRSYLIHVNNRPDGPGDDANPGTQRRPVATADEAFRRLPCCWHGRAEIIFAVTGEDYPVITDAVYFGTPIGPEASPLVIRGGYTDEFTVVAARSSRGDHVDRDGIGLPTDQAIGAVLKRHSVRDGLEDTAISIRGNSASRISLQRTMNTINRDHRFVVQRPAVTLAPRQTLNLTSHDARSLNLTLIGIKIAPDPGKDLNLFNLRAQCDTCELSLSGASAYVHTNSRIQGGIGNPNLSPGLFDLDDGRSTRAQAGVYIYSDATSNNLWVVRGGVLGGHLTIDHITVRVSQGGSFVPLSLEARAAPIHILTGGVALAELKKEGEVVFTGWGTETNKARIRNVETTTRDGQPDGDGLRVFNGGSICSSLGPIHLDICACNRDGIRLDMSSTASFGPPGGPTGLVTRGGANRGFGMNIRNASRALVGRDTALNGGTEREVALDGQLVRATVGSPPRAVTGWEAVRAGAQSDAGSLVRVNS